MRSDSVGMQNALGHFKDSSSPVFWSGNAAMPERFEAPGSPPLTYPP